MLAKPDGQEETRLEMYGEKLPELAATETLHETWQLLGCAKNGFSGPVPFDWQDLSAFSSMNETPIRPYEARCLMHMSRAYVSSFHDKNPLSIEPMERKQWQTLLGSF